MNGSYMAVLGMIIMLIGGVFELIGALSLCKLNSGAVFPGREGQKRRKMMCAFLLAGGFFIFTGFCLII